METDFNDNTVKMVFSMCNDLSKAVYPIPGCFSNRTYLYRKFLREKSQISDFKQKKTAENY